MVGPLISGAVQERAGFAPLFLTTSTLYALSTMLLYVFFRDVEPRPGTETLAET
jgi:hypothetical protein